MFLHACVGMTLILCDMYITVSFCDPVCRQTHLHAEREHVRVQSAALRQRVDMVMLFTLYISGRIKIMKTNSSAAEWTNSQADSVLSGKNTFRPVSPRSSSDASLWPAEDSGKQSLKQDEGCWRCDNQPPLAVEGNIFDGSSFSFSGPYIFCQVSYSQPQTGSSVRYPGAGDTSHT